MKLAIVVEDFPVRSETFVFEQVKALAEEGHEVTVFRESASSQHERRRPDSLSSAPLVLDFPLRWMDIARTVFDPAGWGHGLSPRKALVSLFHAPPSRQGRRESMSRASSLAANGPFDAAVAHFGPVGERLVAALEHCGLQIPVATVFHGFDVSRDFRHRGNGRYSSLRRAGALFLPVTRLWATRLEEGGFPIERIVVHHAGIDIRRFPFRQRSHARSPVELLSIGRLTEKKGFDVALKALALLRERGLDFRYRIAGDGPLMPRLEQLRQVLGLTHVVSFLGWQDTSDVARLLDDADMLVVPSRTASDGDMEGLPVVVMEAMASGTPVVATRHSGIPELVLDQVTGWLADEGSPFSIADTVMRALDQRASWHSVTAAARQRIEQQFDSRRLARELAQIIEQNARKKAR